MAKKKTRKFKTEVQQLLDLVIHSLYTKKEIYLRELLSNASDAIDRLRYESLTNKDLLEEDYEGRIRIDVDKDARTITIRDNGIGMNAEEVEKNIGTIASSGTKQFLQSLQQAKDENSDNAEFIGQFGVGFYSAYMVADNVTVVTKRAGKDQQAVKWVSEGAGRYTLEDVEKDGHGTDITVHLREGMDEYMEDWHIRKTVKQYSDYIAYPIVMEVEHTVPAENEEDEPATKIEEETLNSMKAIWKRDKNDISEEEYHEFYKHVSHDFGDPLETIHFVAEGVTEFRALLYIPSKAPFDLYMRENRRSLHLYVKNVFITDDCKDLLPEYLRFVKGVVDSSDLPLNVSREMLQDHAIIRRIRKGLVGRVLRTLNEMREKDRDTYLQFWEEFGRVLKEGVHFDFENREKLQDLLLFHSTQTEDGKPISLKEYVERMPDGQEDIYYLTGDAIETIKNSPHLEILRRKGYEVLLFVDAIDEFLIQNLTEYDGKKLKAADRGDLDLDTEAENEEAKKKQEEAAQEYKHLIEFVQDHLKDDVKEVRLSNRLTDSACCLVADEQAVNAHMERILKAMDQQFQPTKRTLELNPNHKILDIMKGMLVKDQNDPKLKDYADLLLDQALLTEGSAVKDPVRFAQLVTNLMVGE